MKTPTGKQIAAELKWLRTNKSKIRPMTGFGDNNHDAIDAEIEVLESDLSEDDIYNKADEENGEWTEHQRDAALGARRWMDGEEDTSPSENWKPLIQK